MKNQQLNPDFQAPCYEAPDCCVRMVEFRLVIAQSATGEAYEEPVEYDGF